MDRCISSHTGSQILRTLCLRMGHAENAKRHTKRRKAKIQKLHWVKVLREQPENTRKGEKYRKVQGKPGEVEKARRKTKSLKARNAKSQQKHKDKKCRQAAKSLKVQPNAKSHKIRQKKRTTKKQHGKSKKAQTKAKSGKVKTRRDIENYPSCKKRIATAEGENSTSLSTLQ